MMLKTLLLSETDLNVTYRTKGTGEPLVLIHGVGMESAAWGPQFKHFAANYCVIALDMPGHGGSDRLPEDSQLPDYVAWCKAVIEALGLGPVNLVGHSMGALIAGGIAATQPGLIQRVALLNGVFERSDVAKNAVKARAAEIRSGQIDIQTPLARWFDDHQRSEKSQVAEWLGAVDPKGYATAYTAFACGDETYAKDMSKITCPFLAMTGDGDPNSTPEMSHRMAALVRHGRSVTITGHRHMINLTAAAQVNNYLEGWLTLTHQTKELQ